MMKKTLNLTVCYLKELLLETILGSPILITIVIARFHSRSRLYSLFWLMIMIIIEIAVSQSMESPSYILKFSESLLSTGHDRKDF